MERPSGRPGGLSHICPSWTVCGWSAEYCVDPTVRGAVGRGYRVSVVRDAHSAFDSRAARAEQIIAVQNETLGGDFATLISAVDVRF
jgi:nicotinamidase-related amidase